ncbi:MAG: hypothetical protein RBU23_05180 [Candidatus Auribacterota bacterium]|nr:hypothetical protein [Candidatus Auribacterota bacterium]
MLINIPKKYLLTACSWLFFFLLMESYFDSYASDNSRTLSSLIPDKYAAVQSKHETQSAHKFIIVNDFHYNHEAQRNIANLLDYLITNFSVNQVFTEGGSGNLNLSHLRPIATKEIRENVSIDYLKKGFISGEEFLDINADYTFTITGIENQSLYLDNVNALFDTLAVSELLSPFLDELNNKVDIVKKDVFSPQLLEFDMHCRRYHSGNITINDFLPYLNDKCVTNGLMTKDYPNIGLFVQYIDYLKKLNEIQLRTSINEHLTKIKEDNPDLYENWNDLHKQVILESLDNVADLITQIQQRSGNLFDEPSIKEFYDVFTAMDEIDMLSIADEMQLLELKLYDTLITTSDQSSLKQLSDNIFTYKRLLTLQLTRNEYIYYTDHIDIFQPMLWPAILQSIADDHLIPCDVPKPPVFSLELLDKIDRFYRLAIARDDFFIRQLHTYITESKHSVAVVILGGFHRDSLINFFKEKNISYAVVSPHFGAAEPTCDYIDIFRNKTSHQFLISRNEQFLDFQATRGTPVETALANELRDKTFEKNLVPPQIQTAIAEGRATVISNLENVDIDALFALPEEILAAELSSGIDGMTQEIIDNLAFRLTYSQLKDKLKSAFALIQNSIRQFNDPDERSKRYMIILDSPPDLLAFIPEDISKQSIRPPYASTSYYGLNTVEYASMSEENLKRFRRLLKRDALDNNVSYSEPSGNDLRYINLFWKGLAAHTLDIKHREFFFRRTVSNAEARFFITETNSHIIVEDINAPDNIVSITKSKMQSCYRFESRNDRPRKNIAILPFFADGVGSSIRWMHAIRGIRKKNPDEYLSIVLFDIPTNRNFVMQQLEGVIDEVIWIDPINPLVHDQMNIMSHFRQKDPPRVLWELVIQNIIDNDKNILKSYPLELFVAGYDFSKHHPELPNEATNVYASSFFDMKQPVDFPVSDTDERLADEFYQSLDINTDEDIIIPFSLRLDMQLTEAVRNSNLYDTIRFINLLKTLTFQKTGKSPKIIFFGNSPQTFIDQLLDELARIERIPAKTSYIDRIKSLTFDLVKIARELQIMIDNDPDLIDFTNAWQLRHNKFQRTFTLPEQAAILGRGTFATGTNSGALDMPLARGVPGVRLTEYHYLGYNEFLVKDLTINLFTRQNTKSTKYSFVNMVADRAGVETYLNFLTSPPLQNDFEAAQKAYTTMLDYVMTKKSGQTTQMQKLYYVQRKYDLHASVNKEVTTSVNSDKPAPKSLEPLIKSFARWGIFGLDYFFDLDTQSARAELQSRSIDFKFPTTPWSPDIDISVYFGIHSFPRPPSKTYIVVIMPDDKLPTSNEMLSDPNIKAYIAKSEKVLIWNKTQHTSLTKLYPDLAEKIVLADQEQPPTTPRQLSSIPHVQSDNRAYQIILTLENLGGKIMEHLKTEYSVHNLKVIQRALDPDDTNFYINHIEDFNWGHDMVEKIYDYFKKDSRDVNAIDDLNYVGIWLISSKGWTMDSPVPFLLRFNDHLEIEGENIKRGYGANLFLSSEAFYRAYLAVVKGAPIDNLAKLIRFQAHVVRIMSTTGYEYTSQRILLDEMVEIENSLIASFMNDYNVQFEYVAPGITPQQLAPHLHRLQIINKARSAFAASL